MINLFFVELHSQNVENLGFCFDCEANLFWRDIFGACMGKKSVKKRREMFEVLLVKC